MVVFVSACERYLVFAPNTNRVRRVNTSDNVGLFSERFGDYSHTTRCISDVKIEVSKLTVA